MTRAYIEEDARRKKCPAKVYNGDCVASTCMAWRWLPDRYNDKTQKMDQQDEGWCGLAGNP